MRIRLEIRLEEFESIIQVSPGVEANLTLVFETFLTKNNSISSSLNFW